MIKLWDILFGAVKFCTLYGGSSGGGGSQPTHTTSSNVSTNLPEYARPFYEEILKQSGKETYTTDASGKVTGVQDYTKFPGQRIAPFDPLQQQVQTEVAGLQQQPGFTTAATGLEAGTGAGLGAAAAGIPGALAYAPTQQDFDTAQAQKYMDPFQRQVIDFEKTEAKRQADIAKADAAMGAIDRGSFGGGREALMLSEANRNTAAQLAGIEARGQRDAFKQAQAQFNADMQRRQQAELAQAQMQKDVGLAGLQYGIEGASRRGALSTADQRANLERLQAQAATGAEKQQLQQRLDDVALQEFREEEDYKRKLLEFQSNILRGNVGALGSTQVAYTPRPSMASQLAGAGLAGLGLYNTLGGIGGGRG
tara:strand:- start:510 stop:1607 length:1098 start_codon:yes stop_codon:yes gene_type:complete